MKHYSQAAVDLACWCAPETCHGNIIKTAITYLIQQGEGPLKPGATLPLVKISTSPSTKQGFVTSKVLAQQSVIR
jgi:hypothetical protein